MKKIILTAIMAMSFGCMMAQNQDVENAASLEQMLVYENPKILVQIGEIKYVPKSAASQLKSTATGALAAAVSGNGVEVPIEDETMVPAAIEGLQSAVSRSLRLTAIAGEFSADQLQNQTCLIYTATITGCNTTVRTHNGFQDKYIQIDAYIYLTDAKTKQVVASQQISSGVWAGTFSTIESAKSDATHNLWVYAINQLNHWYPLHGHMLEKGFEKGKKQKLKEIYIDLGNDNGLGTGYTCNVYIVRRIAGRIAKKYIGYGKVAEVQGGNISSVNLKRGDKDIKNAFDNGAEIAVTVY